MFCVCHWVSSPWLTSLPPLAPVFITSRQSLPTGISTTVVMPDLLFDFGLVISTPHHDHGCLRYYIMALHLFSARFSLVSTRCTFWDCHTLVYELHCKAWILLPAFTCYDCFKGISYWAFHRSSPPFFFRLSAKIISLSAVIYSTIDWWILLFSPGYLLYTHEVYFWFISRHLVLYRHLCT